MENQLLYSTPVCTGLECDQLFVSQAQWFAIISGMRCGLINHYHMTPQPGHHIPHNIITSLNLQCVYIFIGSYLRAKTECFLTLRSALHCYRGDKDLSHPLCARWWSPSWSLSARLIRATGWPQPPYYTDSGLSTRH